MLRSKELTDPGSLRRRVVELELENKRLRETREHVTCGQCKNCADSPEGAFHRCVVQGMRIVALTDYCSDGKQKTRPRPDADGDPARRREWEDKLLSYFG